LGVFSELRKISQFLSHPIEKCYFCGLTAFMPVIVCRYSSGQGVIPDRRWKSANPPAGGPIRCNSGTDS